MYAEVLYTQPSWCSFSSWPHSDITSLTRSVTCIFLALPFFTAELFLEYTVLLYCMIQLMYTVGIIFSDDLEPVYTIRSCQIVKYIYKASVYIVYMKSYLYI